MLIDDQVLTMVSGSGEILRRARKLSGLSQSEVARRAGVSQPVISAYERGRREPGLSMLVKLIDATGCDVSIEVRPLRSDAGGGVPRSSLARRLG